MPFLFYDWTFLDMRNLEENVLFSTLIPGSVFATLSSFTGMRYIWWRLMRIMIC